MNCSNWLLVANFSRLSCNVLTYHHHAAHFVAFVAFVGLITKMAAILKRIRSGPHRSVDNNNIKRKEEQQVPQAQKIVSLSSLPPPSEPNPNRPTRAVTNTQLHLQPNPGKQPKATQLKHPLPESPAATKLDMSESAIITQVYGPSANIYTDILSVSHTASQQEIREAFFCLRYGIYQQLSEEGDANGPLSQEERKKMEMKMDAISAAFQMLSDRNKRKMYDNSLAQKQGGGGRGGVALEAPTRDSPTKQSTQESSLSIGQKRSMNRRQMNLCFKGFFYGSSLQEILFTRSSL